MGKHKQTTVITLRDEREVIDWLKKARGIGLSRPILESFKKEGELLMTTDGYCVHATQAPPCVAELPDGHYQICEAAITWEWNEDQEDYPDLTPAWPTGNRLCQFRVTPSFLARALEGYNNPDGVYVSVYDDRLVIQDAGGDKRYAVVVLMAGSNMLPDHLWTPEAARESLGSGL